MERFCKKESKLYTVHFVAFITSILILWFLAQYRDSYPYVYAVLLIWALALAVTVATAGAIIIKHSGHEIAAINGKPWTESYYSDENGCMSNLESSRFDGLTFIILLRKGAHDVLNAALVTGILSMVLIFLGLNYGSDIFQAEAASSVWRSVVLICWIYTGLFDIFHQSERQHRF